jgi:serine/threonine-protein kinase
MVRHAPLTTDNRQPTADYHHQPPHERLPAMKEWLPPGKKIGRFKVASRISAGGIGEVYLAEEMANGRVLALKLLPEEILSDQHVRQRFNQIFSLVAKLHHPNFCEVYESGYTNLGRPYVAMEYLRGQSFDSLSRGPEVPISQIVYSFIEIAEALYTVHARGWFHLAIKPTNLMLVSKQAKIMDLGFGVAFPISLSQEAAESVRVTAGKAQYLSPEQVMDEKPDQRSDVFSLGAIFYELLVGRPLFGGLTVDEVIAQIILAEPELIADYRDDAPPELDLILSRALAKDINDRYQTMGEFALDLRFMAAQQQKWPQMPPLDSNKYLQASGRNGRAMTDEQLMRKLALLKEGDSSIVNDLKQLLSGLLKKKK